MRRANTFWIAPVLSFAVLIALSPTARCLDYVESSTGLGTPALEGGRTELELADVDADGHLDLISIGDHGSPYINTQEHGIMVWFGDGSGSWSVFQYGNFGYGGIAAGDVNGDGHMDVGYGMHHDYSSTDLGDQILEVALGDGTGMFWTPWDDGLATNGETWGMFGTDFADVDNDGDLDVGSTSFGCCAGVHVYLNQGDGTWVQSFGFLGGNCTMEFAFGDVNGDGRTDFAVGHQYGTVYLGDGEGGFSLADNNLPSGGGSGRPGPDLGDVNGDGKDDVSFSTTSNGVAVWLWDDSGVWQAASNGLPASGGYDMTQLHDVNGDGLVDLAAFGSGTVSVWLGDGAGNWALATSFNVGTPGSSQAFRVGGDVDHNGLADIVLVEEQGSWPNYRNHLKCFREDSSPSDLTIRFEEPSGGEHWILGSIRFIDWASAVIGALPGRVGLELSVTGSGGPWEAIAEDLPNNGRFQWAVAAVAPSADCHLRARVTAGLDTAWAVSERFAILAGEPIDIPVGGRIPSPRLAVHPNPMRSGAWFVHSIPGIEPPALELFDLSGRLVARWTTPPSSGGRCTTFWDGHDLAGRRVADGVYRIRLRARGTEIIRSLVVIR